MATAATKLSKDNVFKIAKLARLTISNDEVEQLGGELSSILSYISKLNELNTDNVPPSNQITGLVNVTRDDVVIPETVLSQEEALANAPHKKGDLFEVDAVFNND